MFKPSLLALTCALTPAMASADWFFQPKVGFEVRNFEFESGEIQGEASIPSLIVGFTIANSDGYYFDFDFSSGNDDVSGFYPEDDYIERFDVTVSAGYSLGSGYTVFGGLNETDTQAENRKGQINQPEDYQFTSFGPFLGLAKTFPLSKQSSLTLSLAGAILEGAYEGEYLSEDIDAGGESIGYSASISYAHRFAKVISLSTGVKTQSYTYTDMINDGEDGSQSGNRLPDTTDELTSLFIKLAYTF